MNFRCGFVALLGRPNVGKSSLCNRLVGEDVAIVTAKPQTTRHRIIGIATNERAQLILVDTPGIHETNKPLNQAMVETARVAGADADCICLVSDAREWGAEERALLAAVRSADPIIVRNKSDLLTSGAVTTPSDLQGLPIHLVSATSGDGLDALRAALEARVPEGPALYDAALYTERPVRFLAAELVRKAAFELLHEEIPYGLAVEIESFKEEGRLTRIHALLIVDRESHKRIVVGQHGQMIRAIGTAARPPIEQLVGGQVYLELFVKVKPGWTKDLAELRRMGLKTT
ncbi:MAG: GTPase Era [Deltaproteobacteria bacterium]|nr:GTPase Era [Deltaproteobacteria bacterium]